MAGTDKGVTVGSHLKAGTAKAPGARGTAVDVVARLTEGPIIRRTVAEEIRERILEAIAGGLLRPGDRLPAERTLCEGLGVARTSVREAVQGLLTVGLVVRRGHRTFVAEQLPGLRLENERRSLLLAELFEVRRLIEVPIAELAAERATGAERLEITTVARSFRARMAIDAFQALNRDFHWAMARAAHNALLAELFAKVSDALTSAEAFAWPPDGSAAACAITSTSARDHRAMARAIQIGDAKQAAKLASEHLYEMEHASLGRGLGAAADPP